jgi:hypothetical protein
MKRKTFNGEWGWLGWLATATIVFLVAGEAYVNSVGVEPVNWAIWAVNVLLVLLVLCLMRLTYNSVRRHNAKVDAREARDEWQEPTRPKRFEVSDESDHDPGPYWHR